VATPVSVFTISGHVKEPNDSGIGFVDIVYGDPEILDQFQEEAVLAILLDSQTPHWQEFAPSQAKLARIEYRVARYGNPGDMTVRIANSEEQTLWSATIPQDQIPMNVNWISVPVEPTLVLIPETTYKIHWTTSVPSPDLDNRYVLCGLSAGHDLYTRGETDLSWPNFDYGFRTYSGDVAISTDSGGYYRIYMASGCRGPLPPRILILYSRRLRVHIRAYLRILRTRITRMFLLLLLPQV